MLDSLQEDRENGKLVRVRILLNDGRTIYTDGKTLEVLSALPHLEPQLRLKLQR